MIKVDMHMQVHMHTDGMNLRKLLIVIIIMFQFTSYTSLFTPIQHCKADTPPTLYVGLGEIYRSIQDALNDATDGYRIFVFNGTYHENLIINHRIDLFGEDRSNTIINGNRTTVITVNADNVNISHFTITNTNALDATSIIQMNGENSIITDNIVSSGYHGISLLRTDNHLIYDNIIQNNAGDGIRLYQSYNNVNISFNTITGNKNGVYLYASDGINIYNNNIQHNNQSGVFLNSTCQNNIIRRNNVSRNGIHGIYLNDYSDYQTIEDNNLFYNNNSGMVLENCSMNFNINNNRVIGNQNYGIMIVGSTNTLRNNIISSNKKDGIYFSADDNNTVYNNTISANALAGIRMYNSTNNNIRNNRFFSNDQYGVYIDFFAQNNLIYNNFFQDNLYNALDKSINRNRWNVPKREGMNIIQGTTVCGNYWDDYDESSEGAIDVDLDGVADAPYTIYTLNSDNGPLLDTIKPTMGLPAVVPGEQTLGKTTNLSITVIDNTEIKDVYVNLLLPTGHSSNFSITQNKTGDTYYCNKKFTPTGNYTFFVVAKDPRNWNNSTNQTFSIRPGNPPGIKDNSPTTGKSSKTFTFNATVTSSEATSSDLQVYVVWNHGSRGNNSTMTLARGNYFVGTITLSHSIENLTYHYYACDTWGNHRVTEEKRIKIVDTEKPVIRVNRHGSSFDDLPNSYTFGATVTDDSIVSTVTIEYWYHHSKKMSSTMNAKGNNYYEKVILIEEKPERVYCIINATDITGKTNNSKNPYAYHGGPYVGYILEKIMLNGSRSFDLDGTISSYEWDFGDGTTGNGSTVTHVYHSNGTYPVTLLVTDDEGNTGISRTETTIISLDRHVIPLDQLDYVNIRYQMTLTEPFFCYDSDGNGIVDTFVDPNQELFAVHNQPVNFNGNILFLLSIGSDAVPEFFWNTTTDLMYPISYSIGIIQNKVVDIVNEQAQVIVTVNKAQWIYFEINDEYPDAPVLITTSGRTISVDKFWRENNKIYVFDDPETTYQFSYYAIFPAPIAVFSPPDGGIINGDHPTIKITYNVPVMITSARFGSMNVQSQLIRLDDTSYLYTPPGYLENGSYPFEITAQALQGKGSLASSVVYLYFAYLLPPQKSFLEANGLLILVSLGICMIGGLLLFFKVKNVSVDGFVYIRNKKIIPFFKSVIVGPVSVQIPDEHLSRAEFYVDGQLKDEVSSFPVFWQWNEKAFLKHTLETKVYDQEGNSASSGEMEFFIFNVTKEKQL
ncbi:MAG: right-handed parallel beta-helix repeat-containing protein [Candidatus Thermoplasmatota archaeon]|nr:right-handed parallel beta-helix repeat-containing protein [Candidatus Thermoplasmatota archaeon]